MTDQDDAEVLALRAFGAKTNRWRKAIGIPFVVIAVGGAIAGYFQVEAWLVASSMPTKGPIPLLMHGAGALVPFVGFLAMGIFLARRITNARRNQWLATLAEEHGLERERMIESAEIFD